MAVPLRCCLSGGQQGRGATCGARSAGAFEPARAAWPVLRSPPPRRPLPHGVRSAPAALVPRAPGALTPQADPPDRAPEGDGICPSEPARLRPGAGCLRPPAEREPAAGGWAGRRACVLPADGGSRAVRATAGAGSGAPTSGGQGSDAAEAPMAMKNPKALFSLPFTLFFNRRKINSKKLPPALRIGYLAPSALGGTS